MSKRRQRRIGLIHPRLAMTIALLPASAGLMGVWALLTVEHLADDFPALFFGVLFAVPTLTFYWGSVLIWSPSIYWTPDKRNVVAISSMALVVALILAAATVGDANGPQSFILPCLVAGVGSGVAVGVTFTKLYTAPRAPQPDPIPCPACGANLRGQREIGRAHV